MSFSAMTNLAAGDLVTEAEWDKVRTNFDDLHARTTPAADTDYDNTRTTTSTSYATLTNAPAVTATTGTAALVMLRGVIWNSAANQTFLSFAVSGATTTAASDNWALVNTGTNVLGFQVCTIVALTAGSNTFTARGRVTAGTGSFTDMELIVVPLATL